MNSVAVKLSKRPTLITGHAPLHTLDRWSTPPRQVPEPKRDLDGIRN
jgi:hypothetical protein